MRFSIVLIFQVATLKDCDLFTILPWVSIGFSSGCQQDSVSTTFLWHRHHSMCHNKVSHQVRKDASGFSPFLSSFYWVCCHNLYFRFNWGVNPEAPTSKETLTRRWSGGLHSLEGADSKEPSGHVHYLRATYVHVHTYTIYIYIYTYIHTYIHTL